MVRKPHSQDGSKPVTTPQRFHAVQQRGLSQDEEQDFLVRMQEELPLLNIPVVKPASSQEEFMVDLVVDTKPLVIEATCDRS